MSRESTDPTNDSLSHPDDAGAYVGNRPEREAETIPGGVKPADQRIAAYESKVGVDGEPDGDDPNEQGDDARPRERGDGRGQS